MLYEAVCKTPCQTRMDDSERKAHCVAFPAYQYPTQLRPNSGPTQAQLRLNQAHQSRSSDGSWPGSGQRENIDQNPPETGRTATNKSERDRGRKRSPQICGKRQAAEMPHGRDSLMAKESRKLSVIRSAIRRKCVPRWIIPGRTLSRGLFGRCESLLSRRLRCRQHERKEESNK